ncbi:MAG: LamG domain-containing protein, partial [Chloroflexi bacterium]|nr:LamG domain-containing protein [Chloroflexota bacterium]
FVSLSWNRNGALSFPIQRDADADGLLSQAQGGADPDDNTVDTDGDGLNDVYELIHGTDPEMADTDQDNLTDREEIRYRTDPLNADPDGDGLNDYIEVVQGWLIVYAYAANGDPLITRIWSDPFVADADGDALGDLEEFVFGFNPWVKSDPSIINDIVAFDNMRVDEDNQQRLLTRFEEGAGVTAFGDSSGWGNTAVCDNFANACPTSGEDGRFGSAIAFDGTDTLSIAAGNINLANQSFTLSAWAKRNAPGADNYIINQGSTANNTGLLFGFRSDNLFTCAFWGNDLTSPVAYTDTEWHHWACSYNADTSTRTLYRDGLQVAQDTASAHY